MRKSAGIIRVPGGGEESSVKSSLASIDYLINAGISDATIGAFKQLLLPPQRIQREGRCVTLVQTNEKQSPKQVSRCP